MHETSKALAEVCPALADDHGRGLGTQHRKHAVGAPLGRERIPERQARRDEPCDLLITWRIVTMNAIDRVSASSRLEVAACQKAVQVFADTVHFHQLLAILPSQLQ